MVTRFLTPIAENTFSSACPWLHAFQRLSLITRFPALVVGYTFSSPATGYTFSSAWYWLHAFQRFPRLWLVTRFLAPVADNTFPSTRRWLHVFQCLPLATRFLAPITGYTLSSASRQPNISGASCHRFFLLARYTHCYWLCGLIMSL